MAGPAASPEAASPRLPQVLARRTVVAVAAIVILCVPFAVFAAIIGDVVPFHPYARGTWGPKEADRLLTGRETWHDPAG